MSPTNPQVVASVLELGRCRCQCCGSGPSLRIIALQVGVSHTTVANIFRDYGLTKAKQTIHFRRVPRKHCHGCGGEIVTEPCVLCLARKGQPQEAASA